MTDITLNIHTTVKFHLFLATLLWKKKPKFLFKYPVVCENSIYFPYIRSKATYLLPIIRSEVTFQFSLEFLPYSTLETRAISVTWERVQIWFFSSFHSFLLPSSIFLPSWVNWRCWVQLMVCEIDCHLCDSIGSDFVL